MTYGQELTTAFERSKAYKLIDKAPELKGKGILTNETLRKELSAACLSFTPPKPVGLCLLVAQNCRAYISERLNCQAWLVVGWMSDISGEKSFWKMDPDELCRNISSNNMGVAEFHAWVMLETAEIIDPVVYPTLAALFPRFSRGAGRTNFIMNTGRTYKVTHGLPLLQYHPQAIISHD